MEKEVQLAKVAQALNTLAARAYDVGRYFVTIDQVDNCRSRNYQRNFNRFYRVRRGVEWQSVYYEILLREYGNKPSFAQIITEMYERTGNVEPSFSSKLVATLDTDKPVWDKYVLMNLGKTLTGTKKEVRLNNAIALYRDIEEWYNTFLSTKEAKQWISLFDEKLTDFVWLSPTKKNRPHSLEYEGKLGYRHNYEYVRKAISQNVP
ncbi:hypothetical protein [Bacteroides acidifaciens]|uniref:hypothetical protein n=1 Tax=Bacteroides acidifaciens TaxID=85831 RepID=UPI0025B796B6|nr:hypothetical protein [Bacteroides acidifaciens]